MKMLRRAVYCERLKARGTLIWPAFLLIPVIPVLLEPEIIWQIWIFWNPDGIPCGPR